MATFMARPVCFLTLLLSCFSGHVSTQDCKPLSGSPAPGCTCVTDSGVIDLTSIASRSGEQKYTADDPSGPYTYVYNPCFGMSQSACSDSDTSICQFDSSIKAYVAVSKTASQKIVYDGSSYYVHYVGGDDGRTANVQLECSESQTNPSFTFLSEETGLVYNFQLTTACACPGVCADAPPPTGSGPTGSIDVDIEISGPIGISLMCLFIVAVFAYFIAGVLILKFRYHRQGLDLIPQRQFWFSLPFLIKDGCIFTFSPCLNKAGIDCGKKGYNRL